ncbi:hypothetical protein EW146_g6846 [Bondarzewia mesenterica]|uniref:5-formyltetrahydrofolate cyclo-ligase n=1 Tax=Bondarzewia mesenterica TaxID=1095465 RepID=A0A4S4LT21_9AGAM|nr:hypothetical protein EW146_g6846 [Bondarzewia mesenterica]
MPAAEVDTAFLVSEILISGKTLYVPKVGLTTEGPRMEFLKVYDPGEDDLKSFPVGVWGIREPTDGWMGEKRMSGQFIALFSFFFFSHQRLDVDRIFWGTAMDAESDSLDVIFLPGIAFDRSMSRLGHGKGYYDRFIASYAALADGRGRKRPLLVALALRQQLLGERQVPFGEHDCRVDVIVTPDEVVGDDSFLKS